MSAGRPLAHVVRRTRPSGYHTPTMKIVCGFTWGIWWWRTSAGNTRVADRLANLPSLDECVNDMALLKAAGIEGLRQKGIDRGIPGFVPLDLVSAVRAKHQSSNRYQRHLWSWDIPSGSVSLIASGVYVFTPCLCLLQVSAGIRKLLKGKLDERLLVVVIARLGCELCGQYSLAGDKGSTEKRLPLAATGDVARTIAWATANGVRGVSMLRAAFPWMLDNLRSPKETDLYLLLCLPSELGGFGLPLPRSNYDIDVREVKTGFFAHRTVCNVDFYWGQARLVVEYDSWEHHAGAGEKKVAADRQRADALRGLGYTVVTVERDDLYNAKRLRAKAQEIADALKTSLPPATSEFIGINNLLRNMLLRHDQWI